MPSRSDWLSAVRDDLWSHPSLSFIPNRVLPEPHGEPRVDGGPRVAFVGFPSEFSLSVLLALLAAPVTPAGIVTSPGAHPAILGENALSQIADHLRVPLLRTWRINDEHAQHDLRALRADAVVMASFDQIVGARALAIPAHGWLNVHPSLLPALRGPEPVYWAIAGGASESGVTLHRAVPKVDAGPVLARRRVAVHPDDTAGTLTRRAAAAAAEALDGAVAALLRDEPGEPLDMSGATYAPSVGHRRLETAGTAVEAERLVRAGVPNMPAWTVHAGAPAYVLRARVAAAQPQAPDGALRFPDATLELLETAPTCRCHHDETRCPHLQPDTED